MKSAATATTADTCILPPVHSTAAAAGAGAAAAAGAAVEDC
jgi:hypothetical protein